MFWKNGKIFSFKQAVWVRGSCFEPIKRNCSIVDLVFPDFNWLYSGRLQRSSSILRAILLVCLHCHPFINPSFVSWLNDQEAWDMWCFYYWNDWVEILNIISPYYFSPPYDIFFAFFPPLFVTHIATGGRIFAAAWYVVKVCGVGILRSLFEEISRFFVLVGTTERSAIS